MGGELGEGTEAGVGNDNPRPDNFLPVSRSMTELEREPGGSGNHTTQRERNQKGLHSHAYEWAGRGSKSMLTAPFQSPHLTDDAGKPAVSGPVRVGATTSKYKFGWKRTTSSAAKLFPSVKGTLAYFTYHAYPCLSDLIRDSSLPFGLLKLYNFRTYVI